MTPRRSRMTMPVQSATESGTPARLPRIWKFALIAATLLSLMVGAAAAYNRIPWSDEGWFSSASYNLARHGFMGTTILDPVARNLPHIDRRTYWVMPLYLIGQAAWLKLFPATCFSVRLYTLFWVPIALFAFYRFLWRVACNAQASALAVCLLALSFIFIDNAGFARPDLMCCALGLSGLAAFMEWREQRFHLALIASNALIAASGLTHPNGIFHLLGLAVVILYYDRRRLNGAALAASALPYLVLGAGWGLYILQDPSAFVAQMRGNSSERWSGTLNPFVIVWDEIRLRYLVVFGLATRGWALLKLVALGVYLAAMAGALGHRGFRRRSSTRLLLLLVGVYFAAMAVFNQKLSYYFIHILPWYIALSALYVVWLWGVLPRLRPWLAVLLIGLTGVEVGGILLKARLRSNIIALERSAITFARTHAGPEDRIVASAALIYGFDFDSRLRDDPWLGLTGGRTPDVIVIEPIYRELYDSWRIPRAAEDRAIAQRLATYRLALDNGGCQVYLRPGR